MFDELDLDDLEKLVFDETAAELEYRWGDRLRPNDLGEEDDTLNEG